jgi:hypothetical protein
MLEWLKQNWFLFVAILMCGIAWGQVTSKVEELDRRLTEYTSKELKIDHISNELSRIDERTRLLLDEQKNHRELLNNVLQDLKK